MHRTETHLPRSLTYSSPSLAGGTLLLAVALVTLSALKASALILVGKGNEPVSDAGWPTGALAVANLESRVGWWEGPPFGGGQWTFDYRAADAAEFNAALALFGQIRAPRLELALHDAPAQSFANRAAKGEAGRKHWSFEVWVASNWHMLYNNPKGAAFSDHPNFRQPVAAPRIDLYLGEGSPVRWDEVAVPKNVTVIDRRAPRAVKGEEGGGVVRGAVYDMATRKVIEGATITLAHTIAANAEGKPKTPAGTTGEDGRFEIRGVPEGYFYLTVTAGGYAPRRLADIYHNTPAGALLDDAVVYLTEAQELDGVVTNTAGEPLSGVKVSVSETIGIDGRGYVVGADAKGELVTGADGVFKLSGIPGGFTQLRAYKEGWYPVTPFFEVYDVPSKAPLKIALVGTGTVKGRVLEAEGDNPRRRGQLNVNITEANRSGRGTWGGGMHCKPDRTFEFSGVPPGEYRISTRPLHSAEEKENAKLITVESGKTVEVELVQE